MTSAVAVMMSPIGYARPMACAAGVAGELSYTLPRPKAHAMNSSDSATIVPDSTVWPRVARRVGVDVNANTPATANGTASRKPRSAAEGNGTEMPRPTSYTVQTTSPAPQLNAEAARNSHATRVLLAFLAAASAQLPAAMKAAAASPMSSRSIVAWSPTQWKAVQPVNTADAASAAPAARANGRHPRMPKPEMVMGLLKAMAAAGFCTG